MLVNKFAINIFNDKTVFFSVWDCLPDLSCTVLVVSDSWQNKRQTQTDSLLGWHFYVECVCRNNFVKTKNRQNHLVSKMLAFYVTSVSRSAALVISITWLAFIDTFDKNFIRKTTKGISQSVQVSEWQHRASLAFHNVSHRFNIWSTGISKSVFSAIFIFIIHVYLIDPVLGAVSRANELHGHIYFAFYCWRFYKEQEVEETLYYEIDGIVATIYIMKQHLRGVVAFSFC